MDMFTEKWSDVSLVAFDLETTGKYPLSSEICEIAAVKYAQGQVRDTFATLIKPKALMSQEVINIHGITNEMVAHAPPIENQIEAFVQFCSGSIVMAHHSPFDMGFMAWEIERAKLELPEPQALCTSLLSRVLIKESPNHKLITLAKTLNIDPGNSHRALDDARTCLEVGLECLRRLGPQATLTEAYKAQGQTLNWSDFSVESLLQTEPSSIVLQAIFDKSSVAIVYQGGSKPGKERAILPTGLVRGPERDFIMATDSAKGIEKRYYLNRITKARKLGQLSFF